MPRVTSRPKSDEMMVALDSGCFQEADGTEHIVLIGTRLKASHPVPRMAPHLFLPKATTDDVELAAARRQLLESRGVYGRS